MEQKIILKAVDWAEGAFDIQNRIANTTFSNWAWHSLAEALTLKYEKGGYENGIVLIGNNSMDFANDDNQNFLLNLRHLLSIFADHGSDSVTVTVEKGEYVKGRPINVKVKTIEFIPKKIGTDDV